MHIEVDDGARASIGSVAASMIWPGPQGAPSTMDTTARVAEGAHLELWLEPTVSVFGSTHRANTTVCLASGATACIVEEVVLGRTSEPSGEVKLALRIERDGVALVHHTECFGPDVAGAASSVSVGAARHVLSAVLVGVDAGQSRVRVEADLAAAWLPVADDAVVVLALGPHRPALFEALGCVAPELMAAGRRGPVMV